jgi:hypothetical protein
MGVTELPVARSTRLRLSAPWKWAGLVGVCAAGVVCLFSYDPARSGFYPPCPVYALTGFYCPGCGTARALHQLLHGNVLAALDLNPLLVIGLPFILFVAVSYAMLWASRRPLPRVFASPLLNSLSLWIIVAYMLLRNIPVYPFTLLAP